MPVLPTTVRRLYDTCSENSSRPPSANIEDTFYEVASSLQNVYIVIDALDESQTTNGLRRALLVELLKLSELGNVKILVTSRPLPDILNTLKSLLVLRFALAMQILQNMLRQTFLICLHL